MLRSNPMAITSTIKLHCRCARAGSPEHQPLGLNHSLSVFKLMVPCRSQQLRPPHGFSKRRSSQAEIRSCSTACGSTVSSTALSSRPPLREQQARVGAAEAEAV
jgi:hypothetical protein